MELDNIIAIEAVEGGTGSQGIGEFGHEDLFEHSANLLSFSALLDLERLDGIFFAVQLTLLHTPIAPFSQYLPTAPRNAHRQLEQVDVNAVKAVGEGDDACRLSLFEG